MTTNDRYLKKLIEIYLQAETEIINEIARLRSRGLIDYHAVAALERVQRILRGLENESWKYAPRMVEAEFYGLHPEARKPLAQTETVAKHIAGYLQARTLTSEQHFVVDQLVNALMSELTGANMKAMETLQDAIIGRTEPDIYRRIGLEVVAAQEATGRGVRPSVPDFVERLRREGVTAFVDKSGRNWSLHTYASMVCRTTARQAEVMAVLTQDEEQDLYTIRGVDDPCGLCAAFQNRVYSKSGNDPDFPPLADAFGKVDPAGANTLANTYLNIHPNCRCAVIPWTAAGLSREEVERIKHFSNPLNNPYSLDPRSEKAIKAYRKKETARRHWLQNYRQWERYRMTLGNKVPKTFETFEKHKRADDDKYKAWEREYREENKRQAFSGLIGLQTSTGIEIKGVSSHVIDRALSRKFSAEQAMEALQSPMNIGKIVIDKMGRPSIRFMGEHAEISINPETGILITGWRK